MSRQASLTLLTAFYSAQQALLAAIYLPQQAKACHTVTRLMSDKSILTPATRRILKKTPNTKRVSSQITWCGGQGPVGGVSASNAWAALYVCLYVYVGICMSLYVCRYMYVSICT